MSFSTDCHKIEKVSALKNYLHTFSKSVNEFDTTLPTNRAFIYYLQSGEVIFIPNDIKDNSDGILFKNFSCYNDCLLADRFPIENPQMPVFERYQEDMLNLNAIMNEKLRELAILSNVRISESGVTIDELSNILQGVREKKDVINLREKLSCAIALGEYVRRMRNGKWILLKRYGKYNPYYVPAVVYPDETIHLILDFFDTFFENKNINPKQYTDLPYIKNSGFKLSSLKHIGYPNSFKFL